MYAKTNLTRRWFLYPKHLHKIFEKLASQAVSKFPDHMKKVLCKREEPRSENEKRFEAKQEKINIQSIKTWEEIKQDSQDGIGF